MTAIKALWRKGPSDTLEGLIRMLTLRRQTHLLPTACLKAVTALA